MSGSNRSAIREERKAVADVAVQLAALKAMTVTELRGEYENVFGEPTRSHNKDYLRKKIAWRIQEIAEGGLSERARARIDELAVGAPDQWRAPARRKMATNGAAENAPRDSRLPTAGTVLSRTYKGSEHEIRVLENGFDYRGIRYPSLSKIAREITGTNWNGFAFFGLQSRCRQPSEQDQK